MTKRRNIHHNKNKVKISNKTKIKHKVKLGGTVTLTLVRDTGVSAPYEEFYNPWNDLIPPSLQEGVPQYKDYAPYHIASTPTLMAPPWPIGWLYMPSYPQPADSTVTISGDSEGMRSLNTFAGNTLREKLVNAYYHLRGSTDNVSLDTLYTFSDVSFAQLGGWKEGIGTYTYCEQIVTTLTHTWELY